MEKRIVTISHEFGSGGRTIGSPPDRHSYTLGTAH